jgi:riboflavin biosynthesis pyrimidine reductase
VADEILQLYPPPAKPVSLKGLYLAHDLRKLQDENQGLFLAANFISSLDGRISITSQSGKQKVPDQIANPRDWRLFQELAVQADLLITTGRYLRGYAAKGSQDILRVYDDPDLLDLKDWRIERGLLAYPDLAVISKSMKFPVPDDLRQEDRKVFVFTDRNADRARLEKIEEKVDDVIAVGEDAVDGEKLVDAIAALGYRVVYSAAGPKVHHLFSSAGVVDRLYLTLANTILGGDDYSSILEGPVLDRGAEFHLNSLYYDTAAIGGAGQLLLSYDISSIKK